MSRELVIGIAAGALSALLVDLNAWVRSREANPSARFDWALSAGRMLSGAVAGALTYWGIGQYPA